MSIIGKIPPFSKTFTIEGFRHYIHTRISVFLKIALGVGALIAFWQGQYQATMETLLILLVTFLPMLLGRHFQFRLPHTFEALAVLFIYMALFLGEVLGYYERFWWWDAVLHVGSGFLLGILGFLMVYVLNEKKEIQLDLSPGFMSLGAFVMAFFGWIHLRTSTRNSFLERWIDDFIAKNPRLFRERRDDDRTEGAS